MENSHPHFIQNQDTHMAWMLIQQAQTITLLTHSNPDPDGMAACATMAYILKNKNTEIIVPTKPETPLKRISTTIRINQHTQIPDLIIAFDTANYNRLYCPDVFKNISLINIDHHISNSITGTYNFVDATASSTCEVLYMLLQQWNAQAFDRQAAEMLLLGILYDSMVFRTQATTARTLHIAAQLLDFGINLYEIKNELYQTQSIELARFWGSLLSKLTITPNKNAAWIAISQQDFATAKVSSSSLEGFSNFVWDLVPIDITIIFVETKEGGTKVSLRSKKSDVNALAKHFGGGGHKYAAGIISKKPLDSICKEMIQLL